ncbi:hypothetical protein FACS1894217_11200 [Clostridia bacterium]|nr:hypothetical protein FACS1894217_11200 [Clostridia bacterium]
MSVLLSTLINKIGLSVQNAGSIIEKAAADLYLARGYAPGTDEHEFTPIMYSLTLPSNDGSSDGSKKINVPVTALVHNTSLLLDEVEVRLKFRVAGTDKGGNLAVNVTSFLTKSTVSELTLRFKNSPSPEGMAKLGDKHIKNI